MGAIPLLTVVLIGLPTRVDAQSNTLSITARVAPALAAPNAASIAPRVAPAAAPIERAAPTRLTSVVPGRIGTAAPVEADRYRVTLEVVDARDGEALQVRDARGAVRTVRVGGSVIIADGTTAEEASRATLDVREPSAAVGGSDRQVVLRYVVMPTASLAM